jgi:hypothetical protein
VADSFDLDKASELLDGEAKKIAAELRKEMGVKALQPSKPLLVPAGGLAMVRSPLENSKLISGAPTRVPNLGGAKAL